ncbi:unnamed protein product, partial [Lymnaea stagnalis]
MFLSSTATEPIPKRNKIAVKSPAAGSKSQTRSKSPKAKSPKAKSTALKVLNKSTTQSKKTPWTSSSQNNNTNSVDLDDSDSDDFEGTSSGSCRRPVKKNNPTNSVVYDNNNYDSDCFEVTSSGSCREPVKQKHPKKPVDHDNSDEYEGTSSGSSRKPVENSDITGSSPLLRVSRSLFNVHKSSDRIHNNNKDQVTNHSSMEQEAGQVLIRSMRNGVHVAVQTEQTESESESDVFTRTSSTFHQNVHKLIEKITETDIGDVS